MVEHKRHMTNAKQIPVGMLESKSQWPENVRKVKKPGSQGQHAKQQTNESR